MFERNTFILHSWKEELEGEEMLVQIDNRVRKTLQAGTQRKKQTGVGSQFSPPRPAALLKCAHYLSPF